MDLLNQIFVDRTNEIDTYLDLLENLETEIQKGIPRFGTKVISTTQQRILYSSIYLQLYNLIEATTNTISEAICDAILEGNRWFPDDLSVQMKSEWVKFWAKTHSNLSFDKRLNNTLQMFDHLVQNSPVTKMEITRGGGGNWDDEIIYDFSKKLGCTLSISPEGSKAAKAPFRDDLGALKLVVKLRNDLAHGSISFSECGTDVDVLSLRDLKKRVVTYLKDVIDSFESFIQDFEFLRPEKRPIVVREA